MIDTVIRWLSGKPVEVAGKVYIFPAGAAQMRAMLTLENCGYYRRDPEELHEAVNLNNGDEGC